MARKTTAWWGTPGTVLAVMCDHSPAKLVVIDRDADTWERVYEGEYRYAIMHEPSRRATTVKSLRAAREEVDRVSALNRTALREEIARWWRCEVQPAEVNGR